MEDVAGSKHFDTSLNNLPTQLSSFIGRERAMAELKSLLSTTRFLTLTGAGGSGKTRLALQVATTLLAEFEHGCTGYFEHPFKIKHVEAEKDRHCLLAT
jgi:Holliday junction resolvasome RuvABC ATP-dependent DNA helicase subunit